jgi:uncharacterized protein YodC (DUF2158 family)
MPIKPGDVVRLRVGSREMTVSAINGNELTCTYFDGERQFTVAIPVDDVVPVAVPQNPNFPDPR